MLNNLVRFYGFTVSDACLFRGFGSISNGMTVRVYDLDDSVKIVTERFYYNGEEDYHNTQTQVVPLYALWQSLPAEALQLRKR